nr:FAD-dependent oxidoreductase [Nocardioides daedukensis]
MWLDRARPIASDPLPESGVDDLVVGAGITGLTTALLLARAGRRVAVVEARYVGAVATGNTSAKLSLLQGTKLSTLLQHQSHDVAAAYLDSNREGQQWLLRFCRDHEVPVQSRAAVTFAASTGERSSVRAEYDAARRLGLDVAWHERLDTPFPNHGAVVLDDQAQFDPMDVLQALVEQLRSHGGTLHQGVRLTGVSWLGRARATLQHTAGAEAAANDVPSSSELEADEVILATGAPVLDRGLYFAKLEPKRSYVLSYRAAGSIGELEAMYLSAGSSSRSVRDAPGAPGEAGHLLVGGSGHGVGRTGSELAHVEELRRWTDRHFPGAVETHAWSAQDYTSHDTVPYVGLLPRGAGRIHVATGFDKWGMTNGVAAARNISGSILGQQVPWARTLGRRVTRPRGAARILSMNARAVGANALSLLRAESRTAPDELLPGTGEVGRAGVLPVGSSRVEGQTCPVVALCTHVGGTLKWNDAEQTWDCPWHGSRFAPDGTVLEGPATQPLVRRPVSGESTN